MTDEAKLVNAAAMELIEAVLERHMDAALEEVREKVAEMRAVIKLQHAAMLTAAKAIELHHRQYPHAVKGGILDALEALNKEIYK